MFFYRKIFFFDNTDKYNLGVYIRINIIMCSLTKSLIYIYVREFDVKKTKNEVREIKPTITHAKI